MRTERNALEQPDTAEQAMELPSMGKSIDEDLRAIESAPPESRTDPAGGRIAFKATFNQLLLVLHVLTCILYGQWNTHALLYYYDISGFMTDCEVTSSGGTDISQCKQVVPQPLPSLFVTTHHVLTMPRSHTVSIYLVRTPSHVRTSCLTVFSSANVSHRLYTSLTALIGKHLNINLNTDALAAQ